MSKTRKSTSQNNKALSVTKNTDLYTPDSAPINFIDEVNTKSKQPTDNKIASEKKETDKNIKIYKDKKEIIHKTNVFKKYDMGFLTSKAFCRIIGSVNFKYRNATMLSMEKLIELVLNNRTGKYTVVVSEQCSRSIIDFISNATNSELKCELSNSQKKDRIKTFESGLKHYSL